MTRNLLMFILPVAGNGVWQWNLRQVLYRAEQFNGQKILAVAQDHRLPTNPIDEVAAFAAPLNAEILPFVNNRKLREAAALPKLLDSVRSLNAEEATFFCHAKGVTRREDVREWTSSMYRLLLDDPDRVDGMLSETPIVGAFRRFGKFPILGDVDWHFPGTFYWFRHDATFGRENWRDVPQISHGAEAWPATVFTADEAGVAGEDNVGDLYPARRPVPIPMTTPQTDLPASPHCAEPNSGVICCWGAESSRPRDVIITGPARSGTTMMAELLETQLGLPMFGEGANREPTALNAPIECSRPQQIIDWITANRPPSGPWGFKHPRMLWSLDRIRDALHDPLLIIMLRDPAAIAVREHRSIGLSLETALDRATKQHRQLIDCLRLLKLPTVLISFEKLKESPAAVLDQLRTLLAIPREINSLPVPSESS